MIHNFTLDQQIKYLNFIEALNDVGYNIILIDNTFYQIIEFLEIQEGVTEIHLVGKNITQILNKYTGLFGLDKVQKNQMMQEIDVIPARKRLYSPSFPYIKYLGNGHR